MDRDTSYHAILVVAFGGPDGPDDVMPFLDNVTRGRNIPRERLLEVAEHYQHFGGKSPLNDQVRDLIAALGHELGQRNIRLPIYWGNRNWHPMLPDTLRAMTDAGVKRALALVLAAYSSYSSCRQYRENIEAAREAVGAQAPVVDKVRVFYNHPLFIEANADRVRAALDEIVQGVSESSNPRPRPEPSPPYQGGVGGVRSDVAAPRLVSDPPVSPLMKGGASARGGSTRGSSAHWAEPDVAFTAHSIPASMAAGCDYERQLQETCRLVADSVGIPPNRWRLVYQSRSGRPQDPWLAPDILDHLEALHQAGVHSVVVHPVGFLSDHMEVLYDLDDEARHKAEALGMNFARASTVGTHPRFVTMLGDLIVERLSPTTEPSAVGQYPANHDVCPADCCPPPARPRPNA